MRIALFHNLPSGGAKRSTYELIKRLRARHVINVYTLSCAEHQQADLRAFSTLHRVFNFASVPRLAAPFGRFNQALRLFDLVRLAMLERRMAAVIERDGADVVLVQPCQFSQSPLLLQYLRRVPAVYYCQEAPRVHYERLPQRPYETRQPWQRGVDRIDPLPGLYSAVLKRLDQRSTRAADVVLVGSDFMRDTVRRIYRLEPRLCPHGVDSEQFRPLAGGKDGSVLAVGSLTPLKGIDFVIEALARIPPAQRPALKVASNFQLPAEAAYLTHLAAARCVTVSLLGNVSEAHLVQLYNAAFLTAYAPIREPFGLVPLESMACATPVVAVRDGGVAESIVHERTGLLTERDPVQFAAALQRLLADRDLSSRYGCNARAHVVRTWTWDRAVHMLEALLENSADRLARPQGAGS